jgi:SAM-dependent methyltransferase
MKSLSPQKIEEIYNNFVKINYTEEYKNRYVPLPVHKNNKRWRWEGKDFPRVISLLEFGKLVEKYNFRIDKLLVFNGLEDPELDYLENRIKKIYNVEYEKNPEKGDLHTLDLPIKDADFVLVNQTFEHIYNPQQCFTNIMKHMKPGGFLYTNVPACNVPHSEPQHFFTGYTPMGLAATAYQSGLKILEIGQWGNLEYLIKLWTRNPGWSDYTQLSNPGLNEVHNPVITWGLFQK